MLDLETGVSLGTLLLAFAVMLVTGGVAWGSLLQRVQVVEREIAKLAGFGDRLTTMEADIKHVKSDIGEMKAAVIKLADSWLMHDPPEYTTLKPPARRR